MRKFFRRLARFFVTWYANNLYRSMVEKAEEKKKREGMTQYVTLDPNNGRRLVVFNSHEFRYTKRCMGIRSIYDTIPHMKKGCFYHTSDVWEKDGMSEKDKEIRRLAFVRCLLERARLTKEWDNFRRIKKLKTQHVSQRTE